jgi:Kelch motif/Galactose oxidase, central domain
VAAAVVVALLLVASAAGDPAPAAGGTLSGTWSAAGSMTSPRAIHQATLLADGRVLVTGGLDQTGATLSSADLYDPVTNSWSAAASMTTPRSRHVAVLLGDGRVLVAGGRNRGNSLGSAELYDPASNSWTATESMATPRDNFAAVRLADGRVLVAGGIDTNVAPFITNAAELYDPATGSWTQTGHMLNPRFGESMMLLSDGRVLVAGGSLPGGDTVPTRTAEIYDPASGRWSATGNMNVARSFFSAILLADGGVLTAGGITTLSQTAPSQTVTATAEIYDPATGRWRLTGSLHVARGGFGMTRQSVRLPDGKVLVAGDDQTAAGSASAELYDPSSATWSFTGSLSVPRREAQATVELADGRVLTTGGIDLTFTPLASAEVYTPSRTVHSSASAG